MKNDMANESDVANTSNPEEANYINEADFQASIVARIRESLPLLSGDLRVERYLKLKLGHHKIVIDLVVFYILAGYITRCKNTIKIQTRNLYTNPKPWNWAYSNILDISSTTSKDRSVPQPQSHPNCA